MNVVDETICMATVSQKGLTTIPKKVRDILAIGAGDRIIFKIDSNGNISLQKALLLAVEK